MFLWIESHSTPVISLVVFALSYLAMAAIFLIALILSNRRIAPDLKATSPVMLTPLSVIAGLLIAFLAARVWANLDHASAYVAQEASAVGEAVRAADALPDQTRAAVRHALQAHLQSVITEDWPAMATRHAIVGNWSPGLTGAMGTLLKFIPSGPGQQLAQQRAIAAIDQAIEARQNRLLLSTTGIAPIQWIVVMVLALLIFLVVAMVHIDRPITMLVNLLIMTTAIAACLVLLMVNDRPFGAGGVTVQPAPLRAIHMN